MLKKLPPKKISGFDCFAVMFYKTKLALQHVDKEEQTYLLSKYISEREEKKSKVTPLSRPLMQ
ncbi:MAG: hypothetical protein GY782_05810 [Gammaproteobacteria bacterium]|nr:hypothetical protein [Gammaproteobacteria bacterium]